MTSGLAGFQESTGGNVENGEDPVAASSPNVPERQGVKLEVPAGGKRSEVRPEAAQDITEGTHQFYGYSAYLPPDFPVDADGFQVIWQIHDGGTNTSPPVALEVTGGQLRLGNVGDYVRDLGPVTPGQNLSVQLEVQHEIGGGSVSVWRDGQQVLRDFRPPQGTMVDDNNFLKTGIYRSSDGAPPAWLVINDLKIGPTLESVSELAGAAAAGGGGPAPPGAAPGPSGGESATSSQAPSSTTAPTTDTDASESQESRSTGQSGQTSSAPPSSSSSPSSSSPSSSSPSSSSPSSPASSSRSAPTGGEAASGSEPASGTASGPARRDVYRRPFAWDSIWNLPLATTAQYQRFDAQVGNIYPDVENISVDPKAPVKQLDAEHGGPVHVDPQLSADGSWNNCSTLLMDTPDQRTVVQGQPMTLEPGGDPSWRVGWEPQSLTGPGIEGCHGGSGMSGIGGTIRDGELSGSEPLRHALKVSLPCTTSCSAADGGYRWPATKADSGFEGKYGGSNELVHMGSLLALPPEADLSGITEPDVRKVAEALQTYGAYVVDETGGAPSGSFDVQSSALDEFGNINSPQMQQVFNQLSVITNNGPDTPGGGRLDAPRRAECAPAFSDGTGGAPRSCGPRDTAPAGTADPVAADGAAQNGDGSATSSSTPTSTPEATSPSGAEVSATHTPPASTAPVSAAPTGAAATSAPGPTEAAVGDPDAAAAGSGRRICERYGSAEVGGGRYLVQNNEWGADDGQCITATANGFTVESGKHNKPDGPAAYPSIMSGCWMQTCTEGTALPARIDGLGQITSSIAATTTPGGRYNLAYDIWADPQPRRDGQNTGMELMIWLRSNGDVAPIGAREATVDLGGARWEVWRGDNDGVRVISYVRQGAVDAAQNLPITDFVSDATSRGAAEPDWYLTNIQAGFEPWQGGPGLAITDFSVEHGGGASSPPPGSATSSPAPAGGGVAAGLAWPLVGIARVARRRRAGRRLCGAAPTDTSTGRSS